MCLIQSNPGYNSWCIPVLNCWVFDLIGFFSLKGFQSLLKTFFKAPRSVPCILRSMQSLLDDKKSSNTNCIILYYKYENVFYLRLLRKANKHSVCVWKQIMLYSLKANAVLYLCFYRCPSI